MMSEQGVTGTAIGPYDMMGGKVIAVANQKGGVGKTTTALTLAAALARKGKRVLVLDLDPHVCASVHMGLYPEDQDCTLYQLFTVDKKNWPELWGRLVKTGEGQNWDMACGDTRLAHVEGEVRDRKNKGFIVREALTLVRERYEYVLLDCPPQMGVLLVNALVAADLLLIPIQTDFLALHGLKLLFDTLRIVNKALGRPIVYMTLATMYDRRAKACTRVLELLEKKMHGAVFQTVIPMDTRLREASGLGRVVYDFAPTCKGAEAYDRLAEEVMQLW